MNKRKKYDKLKKSKEFYIFGIKISFDFYEFYEYDEEEVLKSYNELLEEARKDKTQYLEEVNLENETLISEKEKIIEIENGIEYSNIITINKDIGVFKGE